VVVGSKGSWLRVTAEELAAGRTAWIKRDTPGIRLETTRMRIDIRLSTRSLEVHSGNHLVLRFVVGIGAPRSPTPIGRFAVTDKLAGAGFNPTYGCCILALSARQGTLPQGWIGGDRIAIHGTTTPSTIGKAASLGCLHAGDANLEALMHLVPLGTPVVIRA
jgi:lipoprotein-anchoring transpeptidase ErfK/SrfK